MYANWKNLNSRRALEIYFRNFLLTIYEIKKLQFLKPLKQIPPLNSNGMEDCQTRDFADPMTVDRYKKGEPRIAGKWAGDVRTPNIKLLFRRKP